MVSRPSLHSYDLLSLPLKYTTPLTSLLRRTAHMHIHYYFTSLLVPHSSLSQHQCRRCCNESDLSARLKKQQQLLSQCYCRTSIVVASLVSRDHIFLVFSVTHCVKYVVVGVTNQTLRQDSRNNNTTLSTHTHTTQTILMWRAHNVAKLHKHTHSTAIARGINQSINATLTATTTTNNDKHTFLHFRQTQP